MHSSEETNKNFSVFVQYGPQLLRFAEKFVSPFTAEDIVHDVFLRLWDKHVFLLPRGDITRLLFASVRNACIDYLRKNQTEQDVLAQQAVQLKLDELDYYSSSEERFMNDELLELLMNEIELLPEKMRNVFRMAYMEGMKSSEIADKLNVSVRTVENQLYRALTSLRKKCKPLLYLFLLLH